VFILSLYFSDIYDTSTILTDKKEALNFLHRRHKRDLEEECDEGCSFEELWEHFEPNRERAVSY
jgi:hypothetical protein